MSKPIASRIFKAGVCVVIVLLGCHLTLQYLNLEVYNEKQGQIFELSNRVDFDDEVSIPTWYSQFLLLGVATAAFAASVLESAKNKRRAWAVVGGAGLLLSIDEVGSIHELFLQTLHLLYYGEVIPTNAKNAWWLVLPFIGVAVVAGLIWLYKLLPRRTWNLFLLAGVVYVAGAAGLELFSNDVIKTSYMYQGIMTGIEETLEMLGTLIALYAIIDYLERHHGKSLIAAWKQLHRA